MQPRALTLADAALKLYPMSKAELEAWTLQLSAEAFAVDATAAADMIRAFTGGFDTFCPQAHSAPRLHRLSAAFLTIARM